MSYDSEIFQLVNDEIEQNGVKDGVGLLKYICEKYRTEPVQFILKLTQTIEDMCEEKKYCHKCEEFAEPHNYKEQHPYGDTYATEEMCDMRCPMCSKSF